MPTLMNLKGPIGNTGGVGPIQTVQVPFLAPNDTASAAATNIGVGVIVAVSDPNLRRFVDLRGLTKCRIMGRIGGTLVANTHIRLQYHLSGNIAIASADAGWTMLGDTIANHTVNVLFYSAEIVVPAAARIQGCIVRAVLRTGDGVVDPTISCCVVDFYP